VGVIGYQFEPDARFSNVGPGGGGLLRKTWASDVSINGWPEGYHRAYDGPILVLAPTVDDAPMGLAPTAPVFCVPDQSEIACEARRDDEVRAGAQVRFDGDWVGGLTYQVSVQRSNSEERSNAGADGEDIALEDVTRHRISAFATFPTVWRVLLSVQGAVQINDGTSLTDALLLGDEDENRTSIQAQLRRPVFGDVSVEIRYAFYGNQLGGGVDFDFSRHTVFAGLSLRAEGTTVAEQPSQR